MFIYFGMVGMLIIWPIFKLNYVLGHFAYLYYVHILKINIGQSFIKHERNIDMKNVPEHDLA